MSIFLWKGYDCYEVSVKLATLRYCCIWHLVLCSLLFCLPVYVYLLLIGLVVRAILPFPENNWRPFSIGSCLSIAIWWKSYGYLLSYWTTFFIFSCHGCLILLHWVNVNAATSVHQTGWFSEFQTHISELLFSFLFNGIFWHCICPHVV